MASPRSSHRRHNERGDATVEAVLVTPVLLLIITAIINFGLWYHASSVVKASAQEGLRSARVIDGTAESGRITASEFLEQLGPNIVKDVDIHSTRDNARTTVEIKGHSPAVIPGLTLPVRALATAPTETFRPAQ